jgi:hypothetical protein
MRARNLLGTLLVAFGCFALAYSGIRYSHKDKAVDARPPAGTVQGEKSVPLSPATGGILLAAGLVLLMWPSRRPSGRKGG